MRPEISAIRSEADLEALLSRPTPLSIQAVARLASPLVLLGAGGKMGPSLAQLALKSAQAAGRNDLEVIAVSRFSNKSAAQELNSLGVRTLACDLLDPAARHKLPESPNVIFMLGHKFTPQTAGSSSGLPVQQAAVGPESHPSRYWAINTFLAGVLAEQYRRAKIVCFSTGNVYPYVTPSEAAPTENTACHPVGEYATTALGRERMIEFVSLTHGTRACLLRLNYAVEARYGVLVDLALCISRGLPVDLTVPELNLIWQGYANSVALAAFDAVQSPAAILNLTGPERLSVRVLATELAARLGQPVECVNEGPVSLLSDAAQCLTRYGQPEFSAQELLDLTAHWMRSGGKLLGKPTKFQQNDGQF